MAKIKEKLKTTVNCMARITLMRQMEVIYSLYLNKHWYDYTEASTSAESWIFFIKISKIERMSFYSFFRSLHMSFLIHYIYFLLTWLRIYKFCFKLNIYRTLLSKTIGPDIMQMYVINLCFEYILWRLL